MAQSKAWRSLKSLGDLPWAFRNKKKQVSQESESELVNLNQSVTGLKSDRSLYGVDEIREVEDDLKGSVINSDESGDVMHSESMRICYTLRRFDPAGALSRQQHEKVSLQSNNEGSSSSFSRDFEELSDADTMSAGQMTTTVQAVQSDGLKGSSGKALCCWHAVEDSDTLSGICIRYGISEDALLRANRASRSAALARKSLLIPLVENMDC